MAVQGLIQYIQEKLHQGYDAASIRSYLLGQGYPQEQVDYAFGYLRPRKRVFSPSRFFGAALFVAGVALMMVACLRFVGEKTETGELNINTNLLTKVYEPGKPLRLQVEISSSGKVPATLALNYRVSREGKAEFYKSETVNLLGKRRFTRGILLPESINLPGNYVLESEANIADKAFVSSFDFTIEKRITETKEVRFHVVQEEEKTFVREKKPTVPQHFIGVDVGDVERMDGA